MKKIFNKTDSFNLNRFINAQSNTYERALYEMKNGKKLTHWMWYIFPQFKGMGKSLTSINFEIKSIEEAIEYYNHQILGLRLKEITETFLSIKNKTAFEILSRPDDLKMKSSMTLFDSIQSESNLFESVLYKYYDGVRCIKTLKQLN